MPRSCRFTRHSFAPAVALLAALAPGLAFAAPPVVDDATKGAARTLGEEGIALYDAGNFEAALEKLSRADALVGLPSTGLLVARAFAKAGKLVEASEKYLAVSRLELAADANETQLRAKEQALQERGALAPRIPTLEIVFGGELVGASVALDGLPLPPALVGVKRPTNPGEHTVVAVTQGGRATAMVRLSEGESKRVVLERLDGAAASGPSGPLAAPASASPVPPASSAASVPAAGPTIVSLPEAPPAGAADSSDGARPLRIGGFVGLGVGGGLAAVGAILGAMAMGDLATLEDQGCANGTCPVSTNQDLFDRYMSRRTASTGLLYGGLGLAALGGLALVLDPGAKAAPTALRLAPTPGGFVLRGEF